MFVFMAETCMECYDFHLSMLYVKQYECGSDNYFDSDTKVRL